MKGLTIFNIVLRGIMESGIVVSLAFWGIETGNNITMKIILAIFAPLLVFGIWGLVDFKKIVSHPEGFRLFEELLLTLLTAYALYSIDQELFCWMLISISVIHHLLVYITGHKLIE